MKRFALLAAVILTATAPVVQAQSTTPLPGGDDTAAPAPAPSTAATVAAREEAQENYNSLKGQVDDLVAGQADLRKRILELTREVEELKQQLNKPKADAASSEDVKQLANTVQEIDRKRQADKELILDQIKRLGKVVGETPPQRTVTHKDPASAGTSTSPVPPANQEGYTYTIKKGDMLYTIAQKYRDQGVKVTKKMIIEANPKMNPDVLIPGTKIFIPDPK